MGILKVASFKPYKGAVYLGDKKYEGEIILGAICNGKQAGGGQILAPNAFINDGLIDIVFLKYFLLKDLNVVLSELQERSVKYNFVKRIQCKELTIEGSTLIPVNLDGEPLLEKSVTYAIQPKSISVVLPKQCPLIKNSI